ncbi:hypothetical protein EG328_004457 [Venturia inaequalis]|uniref:Uncharacterized protein n=1 Tax=Venturia inaequalis TaxID=5025 RepID=A0A8H3UPL7_VENIN|nr:hypothetical protein EG328_004457 [Venturia inaequalis]
MHFAKTIFVAILGLNSFVFAAPVESAVAADASNAAPADLCDQIYERERRDRCERDRRDRKEDEERQCRQFRGNEIRPRFCDGLGKADST